MTALFAVNKTTTKQNNGHITLFTRVCFVYPWILASFDLIVVITDFKIIYLQLPWTIHGNLIRLEATRDGLSK